MSTVFKTVTVTCNDPTCFFVGNYHNTTIESVRATREFMENIPAMDNECQHKDCNYKVTEN
jgi:hypothetical protein